MLNSETYTVSAAAKAAYIDGNDSRIQALEVTTDGAALSVSDYDVYDYLFGNDATINAQYADIGINEIEAAYKAALRLDQIFDVDNDIKVIDYNELKNAQLARLVVIGQTEEQQEADDGNAQDAAATDDYKYATDNSVVLVTYGEKNAPFKSVILNFNDYAVTTTVSGTIYHIAAYDYVVIYH